MQPDGHAVKVSGKAHGPVGVGLVEGLVGEQRFSEAVQLRVVLAQNGDRVLGALLAA